MSPTQSRLVNDIEVHPASESYGFKVGDKDYKAGGHWDHSSNTIRYFTDGAVTDTDIGHEGGHAEFSDMDTAYEEEATHYKGDSERAVKAYEEVETKRLDAQKAIHDKYAPKHEAFDQRRRQLDDQMHNYGGHTTDPQYQAWEKERTNLKRQWTRTSRAEDKEIQTVRTTHDPEKAYADIAMPKGPIKTARQDFERAVQDEGAASDYAQSYVKSGHPNATTEAYAAISERAQGDDQTNIAILQQQKPKSYAAYRKLQDAYKSSRKGGAG